MNSSNPCALCSSYTSRTTKQTNNNNNTQTNYIVETVKNIDRMQKEVSRETGCTNCNDLLVSAATLYNTKPVIFRFGNGETFSSISGIDAEATTIFRIQDVRGNVAVLRLITFDAATEEYTCTNFTVLLDLTCVCSLQCLPPINCPCCANAATV